MLTSTLRQGPTYTYNIFSLLQDDPVLKIGEEINLPRENVARARARENGEIYISSQAPVTSTVTGSLGTKNLGTFMDRGCPCPMIMSEKFYLKQEAWNSSFPVFRALISL